MGSWLGDKKALKSILCWGLRVEQKARVGGTEGKSLGVSRPSPAQQVPLALGHNDLGSDSEAILGDCPAYPHRPATRQRHLATTPTPWVGEDFLGQVSPHLAHLKRQLRVYWMPEVHRAPSATPGQSKGVGVGYGGGVGWGGCSPGSKLGISLRPSIPLPLTTYRKEF